MSLWSFLFGERQPTAVDVLRAEVEHLREENRQLRSEYLRLADQKAYADVQQMKWFGKEHALRMEEARAQVGKPPEEQEDVSPIQRAGLWGPSLAAQGHFDPDPTSQELAEEEERERIERVAREKREVQSEAFREEQESIARAAAGGG